MLSLCNFLSLKTLQDLMWLRALLSIRKGVISGIKISCCFLKITYILDQILEEKRMQKAEMIHAVTAASGVTLEINAPVFSSGVKL